MPTSIALTPRFEAFIREQLASGSYNNASEVVREGLRLLESRKQEEALKLAALRRAAKTGFAAIDEGQFVELDAASVAAHIAGLTSSRSIGKLRRPARRG